MAPIPPDEYVCPLTKELMRDPVVSRYGKHFERKAILRWLQDGNNYCPVTGNPLRPSNLVSDRTLQWKIQYWADKNGHPLKDVKNDPEDGEDDFYFSATIAVPDKRFICPLTKSIMEDPVVSKHGHNFERKAILTWLDDMGDVCPITKEPLFPSDLVSNKKLGWEISQWQLNHGDAAKEMTRLELETKLSKAEMVSRDFHIADILRALTEVETNKDSTGDKEESKQEPPKKVDRKDVLSVLDDVVDALDI